MSEAGNADEAGRMMDVEILVRIYNFPRRKIFTDEIGNLMFIPSGKPKRTHMIDARPVPNFSTSIGWAFEMEKKHPNPGRYAEEVRRLTYEELGDVVDFDLIHAPADRRCRAALAALEAK